MKNGLIKIETFVLLDKIAKKFKVQDKDWAPVSGLIHGSRISEIRSTAYRTRVVTGRAFHFEKFIALKRGLESILGEEVVRKELEKLLEKTEGKEEKLVLLASLIPEDKQDHAIEYLSTLASLKKEAKG